MSQSTVGKGIDEFLECAGWERLISEVVAEGRIAGKSQPFAQHLFVLYMHNKAPS